LDGRPSRDTSGEIGTVPVGIEVDSAKDIAAGMLITCLLFAVSVYLPILGFFFSLLIPVPIIFFRIKSGRIAGMVMAAGIVTVMIAVLGGISFDTVFFIELILMGFVLAEMMLAHSAIEKIVLYTCAAVFFSAVLGLAVFTAFTGTSLVEVVTAYVSRNLKLTLKLYESMDIGEETLYAISQSLDQIEYMLVRILPGLTIAATMFICWSSTLMSRPALTGKGLFFPDLGRLNRWRAPEQLVWIVIASGLMLLFPVKSLKIVGVNALIVMMTIYFFEGIAIIANFFEKKGIPKIVRIFLYLLIALQQILLLLVIGLGFFDVWLNFRKIESNDTEKQS
jgi:uncharacterized protein YybS (DUF2232 family)